MNWMEVISGPSPELVSQVSGDERGSAGRKWLWLGLITLAAFVSRLYGIWDGLIIGDEYYTVAYAAERAQGWIQPGYYNLVVWSTTLFGDTDWAARLPAALMGAAGVPLFYWGFRDILGKNAALFGAVLVLLSGWHLYHSQLARFYSGVFLFALLSYVFYFRALREDDLRWMGGALLANALAVLFHATAVLVPAACFVFSLMIWLGKPFRIEGFSVRVARAYVLVMGLIGVATLPLFVKIALKWGDSPRPTLQLEEVASAGLQFVRHVEPLVMVAAVLALYLLLRQDRPRGLFFLVGIMVPTLGLLGFALLLPPVRAKYIIGALPLWIALAAYLAACTRDSLRRSRLGMASSAVAVLLVVGLLPGFVSHYTGKASLDLQDALDALATRYQPGDRIVVFSHSVGYHLEKQYPPDVLEVLGGKGIWRRAMLSYQESPQRVWVLVDTYRNQRYEDGLFAWLMEHAALKWRKYEWRLDYQQMGFELYRIG